jgi:hypothetical protein
MEEQIAKLEQLVRELTLKLQQVEQRVSDLENGEFGTGIYLEGCSEGDVKYILNSDKKVGE